MKQYIVLILLVVLTFAASLQNSFVWDDYGLITDNPQINLPLKDFFSVFTMPLWKFSGSPESRRDYYRPAVSAFFILNYKIWGLNPAGFHLSNIILHLLAVIILYRIGLLLFEKEKDRELISLIAASIFAVHPVHNEPVGRAASGDVIFGFFVILSLYYFLKEKRYLSFFAFFLALLSKEPAVMLPFALVILAIHKKGFKKGLIEIIPYLILVGMYLILRVIYVDIAMGYSVPQALFTKVLTMFAATSDYVRLLVVPYPLRPFYPARWYMSVTEPRVLMAIVVLTVVSFLVFKLKKDKVMLFLMLFPFVMLAPVIWRVNTFSVGFDLVYIAERFLYIPAMAFSLFISASVTRLLKGSSRRYLLIGWILITLTFAGITVSSNKMWESDFNLVKTVVEQSPNASFAHESLGNAYKEMGRMDDAMREWQRAIELSPYSTEDAMKEWQKAVELNPSNSQAYNSMGNVYFLRGYYESAVWMYQKAIKADTGNAETYYNLAMALEKTGKVKEAAVYYREFIKIAPEQYKDIVSELKKRGF